MSSSRPSPGAMVLAPALLLGVASMISVAEVLAQRVFVRAPFIEPAVHLVAIGLR